MPVTLAKPLARNGTGDAFDIVQLKKALNQLGYYQPLATTGITPIADAALFDALKTFQTDHALPATGMLKPDDDTVQRLNSETDKTPAGYYVWRTVEDDKVRETHAAFNRTIRAWSDAPDPGQDYKCRCWAEKIEIPDDVKPALDDVLNKLALFDRNNFKLSAKLLRHYLSRTGQSVNLAENDFENSTIIQKALEKNRDRFQDDFLGMVKKDKSTSFNNIILKIADHDKTNFSDYWDVDNQKSDVNIPLDFDFLFSIGSAKIRSTGNFQAHREGNIITVNGEVKHCLDDRYDFNDDTLLDSGFSKNERHLAAKSYAESFDIHWQKTEIFVGRFQRGQKQYPVFQFCVVGHC